MRIAPNVLTALLAAAHLFFFVLEAVIWNTPAADRFRETLNFKNDQTEGAKVAINQGLCNAFLARGLVLGLLRLRAGRPDGRLVLCLFLGFIAVAGVVGYWSVQPEPRGAVAFLVGQTGLALAALVCLFRQPA
ncbi:hypothetical protein GobsT_12320 [Gemmata obscuriglobus]|uniref:DUF1304 domain-containing protein n=1 Tax=Gemmata obscuriglobus TaxID=114 RepID=A0A2Z3H0K6_9BACT|nr:DUF1304 family protein [Gemmata obscuriglobus]AWM40299.1 DUF1304 domain-containing protein [Gemmata obscuriglobus]QEG26492.1 hypothetical protein GobsT_12320 [Gemmata obscuriglobus]VTS01764.1 Integral membrane protein OS=Stigmatella aurantiaca (strain DW4/3-1) GN=STIAU_7432 PE=4 SV=1: DUF1304 [Gemmata obscuriglobus UQM 2246]